MQKKLLAELFCIFECLLTQDPTNQATKLSWFFQIIRKTIRKFKKSGLFIFLSENDFKTSFKVNFPKQRPDFGDLETKQRHEPQTRFFFSYGLLHMNSI